MAKKTVKTEETPVIARSDSDAAISSEEMDETAANSETAKQEEQEAPAAEQAADTEAAEPKADEATTETEMTEPDKTAYTIHGCNIRHNGRTYKEGSQIELTEDEAARLKKYLKR